MGQHISSSPHNWIFSQADGNGWAFTYVAYLHASFQVKSVAGHLMVVIQIISMNAAYYDTRNRPENICLIVTFFIF